MARARHPSHPARTWAYCDAMARKTPDTAALMTAGLNLIQQAISIYDADLRLAVCNTRFQQMFDLPEALVTPGARFEDTIRHLAETGEYGPVEDIEALVAERTEQARAFAPHYMERPRASGQTISVEGAPLPQGGWVAVYTDITATRRQEDLLRARSEELTGRVEAYVAELARTNRQLQSTIAALEEAKRELTETEARTRATTEMMPAHIAHVGPDRRYTYSNRRLSSVMPARPSDILGRHISEALGAQAYARIEPWLDRAYAGEASVFEFTDDISQRRIRTAFTPDEAGGDGVYILSMDVTAESQTRAALQQTRRREMAAQLVSGVAHDFSNLLTIILGMQTKLRGLDLPPDAAPLIEGTLGAARRGGDLLNRIADMTGARAPRPEPVDLDRFFTDLCVLARGSLPGGIALDVRNETGEGALLLDTGMLQDVLLNLVLNARDACGETGRIRITARPVQDTWLDLTVSDTGPGFSETALAHALDPFFTTKGEAGQGLGLAMVYDAAKLSGGEVRIANGYIGARVTLRLPYRRAAPAAATASPGLALLVEDDARLREQVREMLTARGHAVVEAASVAEARTLVSTLPELSLVLSDIQLEGDETGVDLARALAGSGPPVFLMSSLPGSHPLIAAAQGLAPVIAKPFSPGALTAFLATRPPSEEAAE